MTAVIGFQVQCNVCPQRALVVAQPEGDWTCPRCAEVTGGFGDVDVAQAERIVTGPVAGWTDPQPADDHYPIEKVRG